VRFRRILEVGDRRFDIFSLRDLEPHIGDLSTIPFSLKVLIENLVRGADGAVDLDLLRQAALGRGDLKVDLPFRPGRVLLQDFSGVPTLVDLAAMRDAMADRGASPERVRPIRPVDLVVDHSLIVDVAGRADARDRNVALEHARNAERYGLLKWAQSAMPGLTVYPPGVGICHQVNLEHIARVVWTEPTGTGELLAFPDTVVGADSHTPMVNALGVLGWGIGGIEIEAAILGFPLPMPPPRVVGCRLSGQLPAGASGMDLALVATAVLREHGVVGAFVEFCGDGLDELPVPDRATVANMAPEYGATCGFFPVDRRTIDYLRLTGRDPVLAEAYCRAQGLWRARGAPSPAFAELVEIDLGAVGPSLAGPSRPQQRRALGEALAPAAQPTRRRAVPGRGFDVGDDDIVLAAITSCTNTSNPRSLLAAGLLARRARQRGLRPHPRIKTSFAPGSQVAAACLERAGLQADLDALGFQVVGFGCATCIGNSGPLDEALTHAIRAGGLRTAGVISGNRNFEGRIGPDLDAVYLMSPPLVVAHALAGSMRLDLTRDPLGHDSLGAPVRLADLWPSEAEITTLEADVLDPGLFADRYGRGRAGDARWAALAAPEGATFAWPPASTYLRRPPYLEPAWTTSVLCDIEDAHLLALLGDGVTTDHIAPAGPIAPQSPAGRFLTAHGVPAAQLHSYGARRGDHEVMMRGLLANPHVVNAMAPGAAGGLTRLQPSGELVSIFDAARAYQARGAPSVIVAGRAYGTGSSRDQAARALRLLGVRAVLAEGFERIHRANLVSFGVLPLQLPPGVGRLDLNLRGDERVSVGGLADIGAGGEAQVEIQGLGARPRRLGAILRVETQQELACLRAGGVMPFMLERLLAETGAQT
jgi:aconitate hydratase